jgi:hypothetical protein
LVISASSARSRPWRIAAAARSLRLVAAYLRQADGHGNVQERLWRQRVEFRRQAFKIDIDQRLAQVFQPREAIVQVLLDRVPEKEVHIAARNIDDALRTARRNLPGHLGEMPRFSVAAFKRHFPVERFTLEAQQCLHRARRIRTYDRDLAIANTAIVAVPAHCLAFARVRGERVLRGRIARVQRRPLLRCTQVIDLSKNCRARPLDRNRARDFERVRQDEIAHRVEGSRNRRQYHQEPRQRPHFRPLHPAPQRGLLRPPPRPALPRR